MPATHLSGSVSLAAADNIYKQLFFREPGIKLLYVTPEKVSSGQSVMLLWSRCLINHRSRINFLQIFDVYLCNNEDMASVSKIIKKCHILKCTK